MYYLTHGTVSWFTMGSSLDVPFSPSSLFFFLPFPFTLFFLFFFFSPYSKYVTTHIVSLLRLHLRQTATDTTIWSKGPCLRAISLLIFHSSWFIRVISLVFSAGILARLAIFRQSGPHGSGRHLFTSIDTHRTQVYFSYYLFRLIPLFFRVSLPLIFLSPFFYGSSVSLLLIIVAFMLLITYRLSFNRFPSSLRR